MWKLVGLSILVVLSQASDGKCRALALEGGGSLGAYQAGAVKALSEVVTPISELEWDVITGVSVGALNAFGLSLWEKEEVVGMADFLYNTWFNITADQVFTVNEPIIGALFDGISLLDNAPLKATAQRLYNEHGPLARKITIGTTDLDTGAFTNFNESIGGEAMVEAVVMSSAIPSVFPYQN
jgi:predicted patatin/cPLA2 family phospholipase